LAMGTMRISAARHSVVEVGDEGKGHEESLEQDEGEYIDEIGGGDSRPLNEV
jgi:hypothetical protein